MKSAKLKFILYSLVNFGIMYIIFAWLCNEFNMFMWWTMTKILFLGSYFIISGICAAICAAAMDENDILD